MLPLKPSAQSKNCGGWSAIGRVLELKAHRPDLTAWEEKAAWVEFPLRARSGNLWKFDGLTLERLGPSQLEIKVQVRMAREQIETLSFRLQRSEP